MRLHYADAMRSKCAAAAGTRPQRRRLLTDAVVKEALSVLSCAGSSDVERIHMA